MTVNEDDKDLDSKESLKKALFSGAGCGVTHPETKETRNRILEKRRVNLMVFFHVFDGSFHEISRIACESAVVSLNG